LIYFLARGGWEVGARDLGLDPLGIEWDEYACATREAAGLRTLRADLSTLYPMPCDGLIASPPCQDFSVAGKRAGLQGERGQLVYVPMRWIRAVRPTWIAMEQVPPVLPIWKLFRNELEAMGYRAWAGLLHAEQYGVPQTRTRAILMAHRDRVELPPTPTHSRYYSRDPEWLDEGVEPWISMAEALGWTGDVEHRNNNTKNACVREMSEPAGTLMFSEQMRRGMGWHVRTRGERTTPGGNVFLATQPSWAVTEKTRSWTRERPATTVVGEFRPDLVTPPGHRDWNTGTGKPRQTDGVRVTVEEAAVLQGFPRDYPWQGPRTRQYAQIGNAFCPPVARAILRQLISRNSK